jgi:hypothetical protein
MGQLLSVPIADAVVQESGFDRRPKTLLECVIDGKVDAQQHFSYKKRSYEEARTQVAELLFGTSLLQVEEDKQDADILHQQEVQQRQDVHKKRRKQKQVVM